MPMAQIMIQRIRLHYICDVDMSGKIDRRIVMFRVLILAVNTVIEICTVHQTVERTFLYTCRLEVSGHSVNFNDISNHLVR